MSEPESFPQIHSDQAMGCAASLPEDFPVYEHENKSAIQDDDSSCSSLPVYAITPRGTIMMPGDSTVIISSARPSEVKPFFIENGDGSYEVVKPSGGMTRRHTPAARKESLKRARCSTVSTRLVDGSDDESFAFEEIFEIPDFKDSDGSDKPKASMLDVDQEIFFAERIEDDICKTDALRSSWRMDSRDSQRSKTPSLKLDQMDSDDNLPHLHGLKNVMVVRDAAKGFKKGAKRRGGRFLRTRRRRKKKTRFGKPKKGGKSLAAKRKHRKKNHRHKRKTIGKSLKSAAPKKNLEATVGEVQQIAGRFLIEL